MTAYGEVSPLERELCSGAILYGVHNEPPETVGVPGTWYTWCVIDGVELNGVAAEVALAILFGNPQ